MSEMLEKRQHNNSEIAVGIDLTDEYAQISYGYMDEQEVETIIANPITQSYMIPTALFKRSEVNQWFAGNDAVKNKDMEGWYIDNLVTLAKEGNPVTVGEETFAPTALLSLFIKRALSIINPIAMPGKIASYMITVPNLDEQMIAALVKTVSNLGIKAGNIAFQSYTESIYYYMIFQDHELWNRDVLVLSSAADRIRAYRMECNRNTTPVVAFIKEKELPISDISMAPSNLPPERLKEIDESIASYIQTVCDNRLFSSAYLIGDVFKGKWYEQTSANLCRKARVFQGNNLFSKGAAYSARNKLVVSALSEGHVFLGSDKLKSNVGMNVERRGENAYYALLDAGINWYEAFMECDLILNQGNRLSFVITPLTGRNPQIIDVTLDDLPKRPPKTTRIHMTLKMESESRLAVNVADMGFGELFPASDIQWNEVIDV